MEILRDKSCIHVANKPSKSAFKHQTRRAKSLTRSGRSSRIRSNESNYQGPEEGSNDSDEAKGTSYMPTGKRSSRPEGK